MVADPVSRASLRILTNFDTAIASLLIHFDPQVSENQDFSKWRIYSFAETLAASANLF